MDAPHPRYFWRRVLAFAIDHSLILVVVLYCALPFVDRGMRLPQSLAQISVSQCDPLDTAPEWLAPIIGPDVSRLLVCQNFVWGLDNGQDLVAIWHTGARDSALRTSQRLRVAVTPDLQPLRPLAGLADLAVIVLQALGSALLLWRGLPTPGKALMGLRVTAPSGRVRPVLRETLRFGPLVCVYALSPAIAFGFILAPQLWSFAAVLGLAVLFAAVAMVWYLLPFVRWRGAMPWDRLAGSRVVHHSP